MCVCVCVYVLKLTWHCDRYSKGDATTEMQTPYQGVSDTTKRSLKLIPPHPVLARHTNIAWACPCTLPVKSQDMEKGLNSTKSKTKRQSWSLESHTHQTLPLLQKRSFDIL
jgi:hypothetical protein